MTFINNNFIWKFYPNIKWQLLMIYILGFFLIKNRRWEFTVLYIIFVTLLLFFYRKPTVNRRITHTVQICNVDGTCRTISSDAFSNSHEILSPAFGFIADIKPEGDNIIITIILNVLDIHAQYAPIGGKVVTKKYFPGKFHIAGLIEKSDENEHQLIEIANDKGVIGIKQIAGVLTRRITTPLEINDMVGKGEYIGYIHLGSRVDLIIPGMNTRILVKPGQRVEGFKTQIAVWLL